MVYDFTYGMRVYSALHQVVRWVQPDALQGDICRADKVRLANVVRRQNRYGPTQERARARKVSGR